MTSAELTKNSSVLKTQSTERAKFRPLLIRRDGMRALNSKPWQSTKRWLRRTAAIKKLALQHDRHGVDAPIIMYIGDGSVETYQITQWLPIFKALNRTHPVTIDRRPTLPTTRNEP